MIYRLAELEGKLERTSSAPRRGIRLRLFPRILPEVRMDVTVIVEFVIRTDGTIDDSTVKVLEGLRERLSRDSIETIKQFRFEPGRYNGERVEVLIRLPMAWSPLKWLARRSRPTSAPLPRPTQ